MQATHDTLSEVAVKLAQISWRKCRPDQLKAQDDMLHNITYELLEREEYRLARNLLDFATTQIRKVYSDEIAKYYLVNRAIAYRETGKPEVVEKILSSIDWSALSLKFQMARAVLADDRAEVIRLMDLAPIDGDEITASRIRRWPLFKRLRRDQEFGVAFLKKYGEPIHVATVDLQEATAALEKTGDDTGQGNGNGFKDTGDRDNMGSLNAG